MKLPVALALTLLVFNDHEVRTATYVPRPEFGYPAGLVPECPGVLKNASISPGAMKDLQITIHRVSSSGRILRKQMPVETAHKIIASEKTIDLKNKKTIFYAVGYLDNSVYPHNQAIATSYSKRGYNVLISETQPFFAYIYPTSARLVRIISKKLGEFLVRLYEIGLEPANLELIGASLGAHVAANAAKYFYKVTGQKVSRITGLDPAGPCFKALDSEYKLWKTDAKKVDVVHTNIDGFGTPETLGHIDIYVNGGEFQPSDIPFIPCLVICSHVRAILYWWQALEHPKKFIAVKCDSVQEARYAQCFNNTQTNYLGLESKFHKPGIYYLGTSNEFPYFRGQDGLKEVHEIYKEVSTNINADDDFIV